MLNGDLTINGNMRNHAGLKVLHVFRPPKGGVFRHVCDLVAAQQAIGFHVGLLCDSQGADSEAERLLCELEPYCELGVHRVRFRRTPTLSDLFVSHYLNKRFANQQLDIIHGHGAKGGVVARLVARSLGARAIYTPHGGSMHFQSNTLSGATFLGVEKLLRGRTDGIIFESGFVEQVYEQKVGRGCFETRVIRNGLRSEEFEPLETQTTGADFVFLGELRQLKGITVLVEACTRLAERGNDFSLNIVGSGPDEQRLKRLLSEHNLGQQVRLLGPIYPARNALKQGQCLVLPSLAESMPYVVMESLAAGIPVIATDVGGLPELFKGHEACLLPAGNAEALALRMEQFLRDARPFRQQMNVLREGLRQRFQFDEMVGSVEKFYQQVLSVDRGATLLSV